MFLAYVRTFSDAFQKILVVDDGLAVARMRK